MQSMWVCGNLAKWAQKSRSACSWKDGIPVFHLRWILRFKKKPHSAFSSQPQVREKISPMRDMFVFGLSQITPARTRQICPRKSQTIQMRPVPFFFGSQSYFRETCDSSALWIKTLQLRQVSFLDQTNICAQNYFKNSLKMNSLSMIFASCSS